MQMIKDFFKRKKILLFLLLALTLCFSTELFLLSGQQKFQRTAHQVENHYRSQVSLNQVYYEDDTTGYEYKPLFLSDIRKFGSSNYVNYYTIRGTAFLIAEDLKIPESDYSTTTEETPYINLTFIKKSQFSGNLEKKLVAGKLPEKNHECLIGKELADLNNLKIGDSIKGLMQNNQSASLTISGIVSETLFDFPEIMLTVDGAEAMFKADPTAVYWEANYTLKDQTMLRQFEAQLRHWGLPIDYELYTNREFGDLLAEPLREAQNQFQTVLILFSALSLILLGIGMMLVLKRRKQRVIYQLVIGFSKMDLIKKALLQGGGTVAVSGVLAYLLNLKFSPAVGQLFLSWQENQLGLNVENVLTEIGLDNIDAAEVLGTVSNLTIQPQVSWLLIGLLFSYFLVLLVPLIYQIKQLDLRRILKEGGRGL
ncbi:ABC transporter permease [Enterococcus sp. LJL90]